MSLFDLIDSWYQLVSFSFGCTSVLRRIGTPLILEELQKGTSEKIRIRLLGYCLWPSLGRTSGLLDQFVACLLQFYVFYCESKPK